MCGVCDFYQEKNEGRGLSCQFTLLVLKDVDQKNPNPEYEAAQIWRGIKAISLCLKFVKQ